MLNSMPPEWSRRVRALPEFADTRQWNCLRHGRHSEVWRVTLASGATLIAKRGVGAEVRVLRFTTTYSILWRCRTPPSSRHCPMPTPRFC